jgi:hypothetical protein
VSHCQVDSRLQGRQQFGWTVPWAIPTTGPCLLCQGHSMYHGCSAIPPPEAPGTPCSLTLPACPSHWDPLLRAPRQLQPPLLLKQRKKLQADTEWPWVDTQLAEGRAVSLGRAASMAKLKMGERNIQKEPTSLGKLISSDHRGGNKSCVESSAGLKGRGRQKGVEAETLKPFPKAMCVTKLQEEGLPPLVMAGVTAFSPSEPPSMACAGHRALEMPTDGTLRATSELCLGKKPSCLALTLSGVPTHNSRTPAPAPPRLFQMQWKMNSASLRGSRFSAGLPSLACPYWSRTQSSPQATPQSSGSNCYTSELLQPVRRTFATHSPEEVPLGAWPVVVRS